MALVDSARLTRLTVAVLARSARSGTVLALFMIPGVVIYRLIHAEPLVDPMTLAVAAVAATALTGSLRVLRHRYRGLRGWALAGAWPVPFGVVEVIAEPGRIPAGSIVAVIGAMCAAWYADTYPEESVADVPVE
jgi:hypothetical protein